MLSVWNLESQRSSLYYCGEKGLVSLKKLQNKTKALGCVFSFKTMQEVCITRLTDMKVTQGTKTTEENGNIKGLDCGSCRASCSVQVRLVPFFFLLLERKASFVGNNFSEIPNFPEQLEKRSYKANLEACEPRVVIFLTKCFNNVVMAVVKHPHVCMNCSVYFGG